MSNWFENHQPHRVQIFTVTNASFIRNSNQIASSVEHNRMFSERILSTPAIVNPTSKIFGSQGYSDNKNWLDFSSIFFKICRSRSSVLLSLYDFIPREVKFNSRFHVAVCLFSNRSQRTSKCVKSLSDTLGDRLVGHFFVLTTFLRHLWFCTEQTHGSMESIC